MIAQKKRPDALNATQKTLILNRSPYWVNLSKREGKDKVFQGLAGLLRGISPGESRGAALPAREKLVLPDSFTRIYILFLIGFCIGPLKMPRQFSIGLPKIHRRFRIGPPESALALLKYIDREF